MSEWGKQAKEISAMQLDMIERDRRRYEKRPMVFTKKHRSRWQDGVCKICGEHFECITHEHAHRHGFANADEMAKSDAVDFGERVRR